MPNYTKLFNSIVTSTIWTEDDRTRIVWITMLAMADQNGEVHASVPGLARIAGVDVASTETALNLFMSPDPYSRTPDNEGRRIVKIDGGWELLNHAKYRRMASKEDAKAATAERVRRHRSRNAPVTVCNGDVTGGGDIVEAKANKNKECPIPPPVASDETQAFLKSLWEMTPAISRSRTSKKDVEAAWRKAKKKPPLPEVLAAYASWLRCESWRKDDGQFIPGLHRWIEKRQWENVPSPGTSQGYQGYRI